jgi:hypothetical protein
MPLIKSSSNEARQKNIAEMIHGGHPIMQAVAAAYHNQRDAAHNTHEDRMKERHAHERHKYGQ